MAQKNHCIVNVLQGAIQLKGRKKKKGKKSTKITNLCGKAWASLMHNRNLS